MKAILLVGFVSLLLSPLSRLRAQEDDSTLGIRRNIYQDTLAPHFEVVDVKGNHWISDSLRGKVVVLNFWSVYCPPCIHELPELNKVVGDFDSDSVVFISVLFEKDARADSIIRKYWFRYHLVEGGLPIMGDFYNNCFPTQIIIDRQGMIRCNVCGTVNENYMKTAIRKTLDEPPGKTSEKPKKTKR